MSKKSKRYETIDRLLGEGQFAYVFKARDTETGEIVAIKKIKLGSCTEAKDGVNRTALREVKLLQEIKHENIIGIRDVIDTISNVHLVFDFMETDLEKLVKDSSIILMPAHVKNILLQTLLGVEFLHDHWVLHRDLKPNNILMNSVGRIKVADFGLARFFGSPNRQYTHQVVTRWYRAPELLFGARAYGGSVDIWAIGCILAELLLRVPIFPGESDLDQIVKIATVLGNATEEEWPSLKELEHYVNVKPTPKLDLQEHVFQAATPDLIEIIHGCFIYDPLKRWSASQCLQAPYFQLPPFPCRDEDLPMPVSVNVLPGQKRRALRGLESPPQPKRLNFD